MAAFSYLLLLLLVQSAQVASDSPRQIEIEATAAVEGDSVSAVALRWTARAKRDATDWSAAFGLATLARLTYDYATADSAYAALQLVTAPAARPYVAAAYLGT